MFRNKIRTASDFILQNLLCNDFATCLIPADVNQVKGEHFSAIKATVLLKSPQPCLVKYFPRSAQASNGMKGRQT